MNTAQSKTVAKNVFRLGFVLIAYVAAESLWMVSGYRTNRELMQFGAAVCLLGIVLDLAITLADDAED